MWRVFRVFSLRFETWELFFQHHYKIMNKQCLLDNNFVRAVIWSLYKNATRIRRWFTKIVVDNWLFNNGFSTKLAWNTGGGKALITSSYLMDSTMFFKHVPSWNPCVFPRQWISWWFFNYRSIFIIIVEIFICSSRNWIIDKVSTRKISYRLKKRDGHNE